MTVSFNNLPFTPTIAAVGSTVSILGSGFLGASNVSFNGTGATYTVVSDNLIVAVVPMGATSGRISVTSGNALTTSVMITISENTSTQFSLNLFPFGTSPPAPPAPTVPSSPLPLVVTGTPVVGANTYNVYRDGILVASGLTSPSYTDNTAVFGPTYCYQLTSVNGYGESALSTQTCSTASNVLTRVLTNTSDMTFASYTINPTDTMILCLWSVNSVFASVTYDGNPFLFNEDASLNLREGSDHASIFSYQNLTGVPITSDLVIHFNSPAQSIIGSLRAVSGLDTTTDPTGGTNSSSFKDEFVSGSADPDSNATSITTIPAYGQGLVVILASDDIGSTIPTINAGVWTNLFNDGVLLTNGQSFPGPSANGYLFSDGTRTANSGGVTFDAKKTGTSTDMNYNYWGALVAIYALA